MRTDEGPVSENSLKIVVMGVSGSGKSLVGAGIATALDATFVDSDALHPRENVAKMSRGDPLDDADRAPWLDRVGDRLGEAGDCVIACSALKRVYRDRIRAASGGPVIFVHLIGDQTLISERMAARVDHFMPPRLLAVSLPPWKSQTPTKPQSRWISAPPSQASLPTRLTHLGMLPD